MAATAPVIGAYRVLLRASRRVFRDDAMALAQSKENIRAAFAQNADVSPGKELDQKVADAHEAAEFLVSSIKQAVLNQRGNYEMRMDGQVASADDGEGRIDVTAAHRAAEEAETGGAGCGCSHDSQPAAGDK